MNDKDLLIEFIESMIEDYEDELDDSRDNYKRLDKIKNEYRVFKTVRGAVIHTRTQTIKELLTYLKNKLKELIDNE